MKDRFHGSARPHPGLVTARRDNHLTSHTIIERPYRGTTRTSPRRGTAHTAPAWIRRAGGCIDRVPAIFLDDQAPWPVIGCWSGRARRWAQHTVPKAYALRYATHVRPAMPHNPISMAALVTVAAARAAYADHRTGRNCRVTNHRLAHETGYSIRLIQRANTALRLLGVATEVLRGRQRTRAERYASWRMGDRGRGWASVWALHDNRFISLSPHPVGSFLSEKPSSKSVLTTTNRRHTGGSSATTRRQCPDHQALKLATKWLVDQQSPPWARRYRSAHPWAQVLASPAAHGWCPRDINALITDWIGTGHWVPDNPYKPIGLLGAILASHDNLDERPAATEMAREQAELQATRARIAAQLAQRETNRQARQAGRAALDGPGHAAARKALADIAARARTRGYRSDHGDHGDSR